MTIDPTVTDKPATTDCWMSSNNPTTSFCGADRIRAGKDDSGNLRRGLLDFDVSRVPADATVTNADLALYLDSASTTHVATADYDIKQPASTWTNGATWNTPGGSASWTGGSPGGTSYATASLNGSSDGYKHWTPTSLVAGWADRSLTDRGFLLKQSETVNSMLYFYSSDALDSSKWPTLTVDYTEPTPPIAAHVGERDFYSYTSQRLDDRLTAKVNNGSGDLLVTADDAHIPGVAGLDFALHRYYNSLLSSSADPSKMGPGWSSSVGGLGEVDLPEL